jgi:uncharacterized membrane protein
MSLLELILVVLSVIVGLGIAEILSGFVRILRGELKTGLGHGLWTVYVFMLLVQLVWGFWALNAATRLTFPEYLIILWGPIALFVAASMLFPREGTFTETSLDDYLIAHRVPFLLSILAYIVQAQVASWVLEEFSGNERLALILRLSIAGIIISGLFTQQRWWHRVVPALLLAILLYFTAQITPVAGAP